MSLLNHPNLVSCYCSFVSGPVRAVRRARRHVTAEPRLTVPLRRSRRQNLWVVMPFFSGGSVLNIMKFQHPQARARAPARRSCVRR